MNGVGGDDSQVVTGKSDPLHGVLSDIRSLISHNEEIRDAVLVQGSRMDKMDHICSIILSKLVIIESLLDQPPHNISRKSIMTRNNMEGSPATPILLTDSSDEDGNKGKCNEKQKSKFSASPPLRRRADKGKQPLTSYVVKSENGKRSVSMVCTSDPTLSV